jgi:hypothetical protein
MDEWQRQQLERQRELERAQRLLEEQRLDREREEARRQAVDRWEEPRRLAAGETRAGPVVREIVERREWWRRGLGLDRRAASAKALSKSPPPGRGQPGRRRG